MREQYPGRKLVACMELHTFSSLTQEFLQQYRGTMDEADVRCVYFSQHALQLKKLPPLDPEEVRKAFGGNVEVFNDSAAMVAKVKTMEWSGCNLLMMSSGNFDGIDFAQLADEIV
jgi:UDP-N-acetylmuramate: L-alanyl-gamma-D-glutamyl-meso-diaminopimelate ligase